MTRPISASIDLHALRHNYGVAREHAGNVRIWAVLKANAYGHGLLRVAQGLAERADGFALIELDGAIALRNTGMQQPILLLEGFYSAEELPLYAEYQLMPVVHSLHQVAQLTATRLHMPLAVYLKLNTGMNRLGLNRNELHTALAMLEDCSHIASISLMTHFADADCAADGPGIARQMATLAKWMEGRSYPLCLANSAALMRYPESAGDWVRAGIMLYGSSPFPELSSAAALGLKPVMTLRSELIATLDLDRGERIGYGGTFEAQAPMKIGIVACGYADGYPRHAATGTPVLVDGQRTRTLGRVSMDKLCVDLTNLPAATVGSPVVLWGEGLPADEVAAAAGTVSYELFCALAARVPVVVHGQG